MNYSFSRSSGVFSRKRHTLVKDLPLSICSLHCTSKYLYYFILLTTSPNLIYSSNNKTEKINHKIFLKNRQTKMSKRYDIKSDVDQRLGKRFCREIAQGLIFWSITCKYLRNLNWYVLVCSLKEASTTNHYRELYNTFNRKLHRKCNYQELQSTSTSVIGSSDGRILLSRTMQMSTKNVGCCGQR